MSATGTRTAARIPVRPPVRRLAPPPPARRAPEPAARHVPYARIAPPAAPPPPPAPPRRRPDAGRRRGGVPATGRTTPASRGGGTGRGGGRGTLRHRPPARTPGGRGGPRRRPELGALGRALARARGRRRATWILVAYVLLTLGIAYRLVDVQVVAAEDYRALASRQAQREVELPASRGRLYDRTGQPLAMSLAAASVYADPGQIAAAGADPAQVARQLADVLDVDADDLVGELARDAGFVYVARQVDRALGDRVADLGLPGIGVLQEPTRVYPAGDLAASVIGVAGIDHTGLSGLEAQYDDVLAGQPGVLHVERAPGGVEISAAPREVRPPVPGTDVVLTIDRAVQAAAEDALRRAVEEHRADGAAAVVLDTDTGEVLALASLGTGGEDATPRNRAVVDAYEPGSVSKVVTVSAALEEGLVAPGDVLEVPSSITVGGATFTDGEGHEAGPLPVEDVIARSSNVGTIGLARRLGPERLHAYVQRFGYGRPTAIGFPGETAGIVPAPAQWSATTLPTMAIGYGHSASLLQVAEVFATVASGGEWVQPSLVRGTVGAQGLLDPAPPGERRRVVSEATADAVAGMLVGVVEDEYGTGPLAAVPGYSVGGKTGTARKPSTTERGYEPGAYIASFAGFAPAEDPSVVVAVMVDRPRSGSIYGGVVAAPVFSEITAFTLGHQRVAPTRAPAQAGVPDAGVAPAEPPLPG